ncbi:hypothetical protein MOV61_23295 [Neorhizobium sp. BETTINA12A]|uniref:hypothetical protein n=1 Tax=Neorhizobium sp. BETTINA12A TaxID=2908924 RepID=UPI001FF556AA|nr:hypothetical protein [Neorhizobium sp. BETTINA12A]MCJ9753650.1 hypothetical protein [Neorhizobium sp. BETTINA12A]
MARIEGQKGPNDGGFALLAVLGFILLFAMVLAPFAASSRLKALTVGHEYNQARLGNTAQAINDYIAWRIGADPRWRGGVDGARLLESGCVINGISVRIAIVPHARLINLNTAEEPLLAAGFKGVGLAGIEAEDTARRVMRFRSPGTGDSGEGGIDAGPKHAPFEDISELHDLMALRGFALTDLGRVFSVQEGRAVLTRSQEAGSASMFYTIETVLFHADEWAGSAEIFSAATRSGASRKVASIGVGPKPPVPKNMGSCASVLNDDVSRLLNEVLA